MNDQRKVIYEQRLELMDAEEVSETVIDMRRSVIADLVAEHIPEKAYAEQWDAAGLKEKMEEVFGLDLPVPEWCKEEGIADEEVEHRLNDAADRRMAEKAANYGPEVMRMLEKSLLLQLLDQTWKEHLLTLDHLRGGIGLRAYGQRDPLNEYKSEAFNLFETMLSSLRQTVSQVLAHVEIRSEEPAPMPAMALPAAMQVEHLDPLSGESEFGDGVPGATNGSGLPLQQPFRRGGAMAMDPGDPTTWGKIRRNAPCPCGTGKKYKHCHGA
jgi:preprotein translocase subunit SecA